MIRDIFEGLGHIIIWFVVISCIISGIFALSFFLNSSERLGAKVETAISKKDFHQAHKYLKRIKDSEEYELYADKLFNAEIGYLMNDNTVNSSDRIISLVADYGSYGTPVVGVTNVKKVIKNNETYMMEVSKYNQMLDGVLSRAISMRNQYLAEKLLNMYKPTLRKSLSESHLFSKDEYNFEYSNEPKDKATEIYIEAVREKKFE